MKHLDLFSGIGGFTLAAQRAGIETIGLSEIDPYACRVLAKNFPHIPNLGDVTKLCRRAYDCVEQDEEVLCPRCDHTPFGDCACVGTDQFTDTYGFPDIITAGFPCQPYSQIGKRKAASDERDLWPETRRILSELQPYWFVGENTYGLIKLGLDRVCSDLEDLGYAVQPLCIPACAVNAPHRRERVWILAHSQCEGLEGHAGNELRQAAGRAHPDRSTGPSGLRSRGHQWAPEPDVGRVAHGIPDRVDRIKALGNAIVPQVAQEILASIKALHDSHRTL